MRRWGLFKVKVEEVNKDELLDYGYTPEPQEIDPSKIDSILSSFRKH